MLIKIVLFLNMADTTFEIKGLDKFKRVLSQSPQIAAPIFGEAIKKSMIEIQRQSVPLTPVDTGRLRGSYRIEFKPAVGAVIPDTEYAVYVHEGTWKMNARPFLAKGLKAAKSQIKKYFEEAIKAINQVIILKSKF